MIYCLFRQGPRHFNQKMIPNDHNEEVLTCASWKEMSAFFLVTVLIIQSLRMKISTATKSQNIQFLYNQKGKRITHQLNSLGGYLCSPRDGIAMHVISLLLLTLANSNLCKLVA